MLSQAQAARYHANGYVVPDYRLGEDALEDLRQAHARLVARHPEYEDYCPSVLAYDLAFLNVARDPTIVEMVGQVLGPDFALWNMSLFAKPAKVGRRTPWHQDGEYWPIRPLATCTVWLAIDASTVENGCLRVLPGSHRPRKLFNHVTNDDPGLTLSQELVDSDCREADAIDLVLEPGQMSLHDVYLAHGSEPNRSDRPRRGLTLRFMPLTSVFDRALAEDLHRRNNLRNHADRTLFLIRGQDRTGQNDFRLRW
ncbi:MAG: phytanoyl-CoA dioxygenase family protein [Alphaproteobacteria bacterium]